LNKGKRTVALISVLIFLCALIFVAYELFQVREIKVAGCVVLSGEQVEALSGLERGQCIFFVDTDAVMKALEANPTVKPVSVSIEYPYSVLIEIEERMPAAYIDKDGIRLTIDKEAVLLAVDTSPAGEAVPMAVGISADRFEVGQPLGEDAYKRKVFSDLLSALPESGFNIVRFDLTYTSSIKLDTTEGFTIELGDESALETKLSLARSMMDRMAQQGKTGGIIDVSTAESAYYREN
jgi:cell division protein FtsQ